GLFDIDFTGGVSVVAMFTEPQDTSKVRDMLSDRLPDLAISDVKGAETDKPGLQFDINTSERDIKKVTQTLSEAFGDKLVRNAVEFTPPAVIEAAGKPSATPGKTAPPEVSAPGKEAAPAKEPSKTEPAAETPK